MFKLVGILLSLCILAFLSLAGMKYLGITIDRTSTGLENLEKPSSPLKNQITPKPSGKSAIPAYQESYDTERRADVNTILNALWQYTMDASGIFPDNITYAPKELCRSNATSCDGLLDLRSELNDYLVRMPEDPVTGKSGNGTRYFVKVEGMQITVSAPDAGAEVSVSR